MQKRLRNIIAGISITAAAVLALIACTASTETGIMELHITDAPLLSEDISGVYITVQGIEYHTTESGWNSMEGFEEPQAFDLMALTRGDSLLLGELLLPAGEYTQIRFLLGGEDEPGNGSWSGDPQTSGSWIEFGDGESKPLFIPSGSQTGYKASAGSPFMVPINGSVTVTADFDLRRAVVKRGINDTYILKPVLRLVVNDEAGTIQGNAARTEEGFTYVVYAFEDSYEYDGAADPAGEDAVTSSLVEDFEDEPDFVLAYLAEGSYKLIAAKYDAEGFVEAFSDIGTVEVTAGETETFNISLDQE